jgi:hypothetical protein
MVVSTLHIRDLDKNFFPPWSQSGIAERRADIRTHTRIPPDLTLRLAYYLSAAKKKNDIVT